MAVSPNSLARRCSEHLILGLVAEPSGADQIDGSQQPTDLTAPGLGRTYGRPAFGDGWYVRTR